MNAQGIYDPPAMNTTILHPNAESEQYRTQELAGPSPDEAQQFLGASTGPFPVPPGTPTYNRRMEPEMQGSGNASPTAQLHKMSSAYSATRVIKGSPAHNAGIVPYFDFVYSAEGRRLGPDVGALAELLGLRKGNGIVMEVYNIRQRASREVVVYPDDKWGTGGLLGCTLKWCDVNEASDAARMIVDVRYGSAGQAAGLIAGRDWIIGLEDVAERDNRLAGFTAAFVGIDEYEIRMKDLMDRTEGAVLLLVYDSTLNKVRETRCQLPLGIALSSETAPVPYGPNKPIWASDQKSSSPTHLTNPSIQTMVPPPNGNTYAPPPPPMPQNGTTQQQPVHSYTYNNSVPHPGTGAATVPAANIHQSGTHTPMEGPMIAVQAPTFQQPHKHRSFSFRGHHHDRDRHHHTPHVHFSADFLSTCALMSCFCCLATGIYSIVVYGVSSGRDCYRPLSAWALVHGLAVLAFPILVLFSGLILSNKLRRNNPFMLIAMAGMFFYLIFIIIWVVIGTVWITETDTDNCDAFLYRSCLVLIIVEYGLLVAGGFFLCFRYMKQMEKENYLDGDHYGHHHHQHHDHQHFHKRMNA